MEGFYSFVTLAIFVPFIGMLINLFFGKNFGEQGVGRVAIGASSFSFVISVILYIALVSNNFEGGIVTMPLIGSWISMPSAGVDIPWQFRVDTLSVTMMLVITGVGTLIHIYATGYMHGDSRFPRFFVYLNLFLFFMLILVTGNNFLVMFVGWEGVGLCSFLLIGFWFDKEGKHPEGTVGWANGNAARKAFIANRVGDFGLLMAMFIIFWTFGTLDYHKPGEDVHIHFEEAPARFFEIEGVERLEGEAHHHVEPGEVGVFTQAEIWFNEGDHDVEFGAFSLGFEATVTIITLFLLLGVTGKSAQIPLFVWLPDAMAGPTPVSALIHAATMVTAGIYLSVRSNSLLYHSEFTEFIIVLVGTGTALSAGFMALGQWDVKKVLAYSTVSQLGFMVAAVGLGAYTAAMFHLVTHAFFKALLFLGSGSIIHAVEHGHHHVHHHGHSDDHDEEHDAHDQHHEEEFDPQDMRNMGGLRERLPITYWTYVVGALALAGVFPLAGFWSKDEIIVDSFKVGFLDGEFKGIIALLGLFGAAAFTAFYIWRQVCLVFYGKPRSAAAENAPESVRAMTTPLIVLAIGTILLGFMNMPSDTPILSWLLGEHVFADWLEASVIHAHGGTFYLGLALIATAIAVGAIFAARAYYTDEAMERLDEDPLEEIPQMKEIFALSNARLYWDESYFTFIIYPFQRAANWLAHTLDWRFWHDFVHERILFAGFQGAASLTSHSVDRNIIDRGFMSIASGIGFVGGRLRRIQTGYVRTYAFSLVVGVLLVLVIIVFPVVWDMLGI
jgi:NADH-quinone oxidoreductase subunit L